MRLAGLPFIDEYRLLLRNVCRSVKTLRNIAVWFCSQSFHRRYLFGISGGTILPFPAQRDRSLTAPDSAKISRGAMRMGAVHAVSFRYPRGYAATPPTVQTDCRRCRRGAGRVCLQWMGLCAMRCLRAEGPGQATRGSRPRVFGFVGRGRHMGDWGLHPAWPPNARRRSCCGVPWRRRATLRVRQPSRARPTRRHPGTAGCHLRTARAPRRQGRRSRGRARAGRALLPSRRC